MASLLSIDARSSRELRAVALALKGAEPVIAGAIRKQTKLMAQPEWQKALQAKAQTPLQRRVLASSGRVKVDNRGVALQAGGLKRTVSGGFDTDPQMARAIEFGANRNFVGVQRVKGSSFQRHTQRQLSWQTSKGLVVYPAATPLVGRFVSLWVQVTVRKLHEAYEAWQ